MIKLMNYILVIILISGYSAYSTDIGLGIKAEKQFKLNGKVGKSELQFISDAPLEDIAGTVRPATINSEFNMNPSNVEKINGYVTFKVKGMETGIQTRNDHLYGKDWLDADKYPEIKFSINNLSSVKIKSKSSSKIEFSCIAEGEFAMHGVTKTIRVPMSFIYIKESAASKKRASGDLAMIKGKFDIALKDFNVSGSKGVVGKKVGEVINIEFHMFYNSL